MSNRDAEIEELMKGYTVKFENCYRKNKESKGTGFILTKDGLIATCSHVIRSEEDQNSKSKKRPPKSVRLVFEATKKVGWAKVIDEFWRPIKDGDIAIVKLKKPLPEGVQVAPLSPIYGSIGHRFSVFGYPAKKGDPSPPGLFGDGIKIHTKIENAKFKAVAIHQLTTTGLSIASGHSGSAVFDLENGRVVGMITAIDPGDVNGHLQEIAYAIEIDELVKICPDLEKAFSLPTALQALGLIEDGASASEVLSQEKLLELLGVTWIRNRPPEESDQIKEKIDSAVNQVSIGRRVVILGEAGMGKSTLLYLICRRLLELDVKLYTGAPPSNIGNAVFVSDNLPRNPSLLTQLSSLNISVIAASRSHEWRNTAGWSTINLTKDDYTIAALRKVIVSAAAEKNVRCTDEGIDLAVEKSGGSPGYLAALVDYLKHSNQALDKETAGNVPSTMYEIEAEQISYIASTESLSLFVLYAIAKTKKGRLHRDQTSILITRLKELKEYPSQKTNHEPEAWKQIAYMDRDLYTIKHDTWKELLLFDWKGLNIEASEPDDLIEARNRPIESILEETFEISLSHLMKWKSESAYRLAQVAVENQPKLAMQLIELATSPQARIPAKLKPADLMDLAAMANPDKTRTWLQGLTTQRLGEIQFESNEAPNYMIIWGETALEKTDVASPNFMESSNSQISYVSETMQKLGSAYRWKGLQDEAIKLLGKALDINRQLVERDEQFNPDLAKTLTVLGASYREKGILDKSIECLKEARDINRKHCAENEPQNAELAEALSDLGSAYWWDGQLDQAIECLDEALKINRHMVKTGGNFKPNLARTLTILGTSYRERGNLTEAIDCLKEASDIYEELSANIDRYRYDYAFALYNLGPAYWLKGRLDEAIKVLEDALKIDRDYADKDVRGLRDLARTLNNLGIAYRWQNRTDDAIGTLEEAASCSRKLTDKEGNFKSDLAAYVYATTLYHLSAVYQRKGMVDEAIDRLKQALEYKAIAEKGGPFMLRFIGIRIMLSRFFVIRGKADDIKSARELCTEVQKLLEQEEHQPRISSNRLEYITLVRGQEDLQSLLLAS